MVGRGRGKREVILKAGRELNPTTELHPISIIPMDTIDANLEQLKMLFDNVVATLRKEKEELRDAQECFEVVSTLTFCATPCMYPFVPCC